MHLWANSMVRAKFPAERNREFLAREQGIHDV
jgi:hypothetical protein